MILRIVNTTRCFVLICLLVLPSGCMQFRFISYVEGEEYAGIVRTKNRYSLNTEGGREDLLIVKSVMEENYPEVFSSDGIPIDVKCKKTSIIQNDGGVLTGFLNLFTFFTFPIIERVKVRFNYDIAVKKMEAPVKTISVMKERDFHGGLLSPIGLFFSYGPPVKSKEKRFYKIRQSGFYNDNVIRDERYVLCQAVAHGIAVKLKELEDSGMIAIKHRLDDKGLKPLASESSKATSSQSFSDNSDFISKENTLKTDEVHTRKQNIYKIVSFERESDSSFAYNFVLALRDEEDGSLITLRQIQQEFRMAVKNDYMESFSGVDANSLYVDFSEYKLNDGKIYGRAVVLTIAIESLTYNSNTRSGKLAVKVNANQYEEARKWVRKNIEILARDKNIALVTGEIPPAAKFYLGREELKDGNILEIEFRTE